MQVPEKLSLIGGSILLASTLVFTLKSQASDILPKVDSGMSEMFKSDQERQQDRQAQTFNNNFQQAQQKGQQTGQWGSAKFYVDNNNTMNVGSGQLSGSYTDVVNANNITTINLNESVQAPQNSYNLFSFEKDAFNTKLQSINNLNNLDTSNITNMNSMFAYDSSLSNLDLSNFNTSNVKYMENMFQDDHSLQNLNLSHFDISHVGDTSDMFENDSSLQSLDLSSFNTIHDDVMLEMFNNDNIHQLTLGPNTKLDGLDGNSMKLSGTYKNDNQTLTTNQLEDANPHPGTWIMQ